MTVLCAKFVIVNKDIFYKRESVVYQPTASPTKIAASASARFSAMAGVKLVQKIPGTASPARGFSRSAQALLPAERNPWTPTCRSSTCSSKLSAVQGTAQSTI